MNLRTGITSTSSPYAMAARQAKVTLLTEALAGNGVKSETAALFDDLAWELAAHCAGCSAPSETTKRLVVRQLEIREQLKGDPFAPFRKRKGAA